MDFDSRKYLFCDDCEKFRYEKRLARVFESIQVDVNYLQGKECNVTKNLTFHLEVETDYKKHSWSVSTSVAEFHVFVVELDKQCINLWSAEAYKANYWARREIDLALDLYKLGGSKKCNESKLYNMRLKRKLSEIAERLISACTTDLFGRYVFYFFNIFPLAIGLGWLTGFEGKYGRVMRENCDFNKHPVPCSATFAFSNSSVLDLAKLTNSHVFGLFHYFPDKSCEFCEWYFVGPLYIAFFDEFYSSRVQTEFRIDADFHFEIIDDNVDEISQHRLPKLLLQNKGTQRTLLFGSPSARDDCVKAITDMMKQCEWRDWNKYKSLAPVQSSNHCKAYVDACDYFLEFIKLIKNAQQCIFIYGKLYQFTLFLERSKKGANQKSELNNLLIKKSLEGVKIYMLGIGCLMEFSATPYENQDNVQLIEGDKTESEKRVNFVVIDFNTAFFGEIALGLGRYDTPKHLIFDRRKLFVGKTYYRSNEMDFRENALYDLVSGLPSSFSFSSSSSSYNYMPLENINEGAIAARMPWHDIQLMVIGPVARDLCKIFTQKWNNLARVSCRADILPTFNPPCDLTQEQWKIIFAKQNIHAQSNCECQLLPNVVNQPYHSTNERRINCVESAYCSLILNSKHYVYIEDECFVTFEKKPDGSWKSNNLGDAVYTRIMEAHTKKQNWKAIILLPLRPVYTFEESDKDYETRKLMSTNFSAWCTHQESIFTRLLSCGVDPLEYMQFYSLRTWGITGPKSRLVSSQIYIHSKIMIVDDKKCIFGSTRVSSNSVEGGIDDNDAIVLEYSETVKSMMDGREYYAGSFASGLRQKLMREHLGCDLELVRYTEDTFAQYRAYAEQNYNDLHTIADCGRATLREQCIDSSVVELAMREVFDLKSTIAWGDVHGEQSLQRAKISKPYTKYHQFKKKMNMSFIPNWNEFMLHMDSTKKNDDFQKLNTLKSLFYLQHGALEKAKDKLNNLKLVLSMDNFISGIYTHTNIINPFIFTDPLNNSFHNDIWNTTAHKNTAVYRCIFYCQPDELTKTESCKRLFAKHEEMFLYYQQQLATNPQLEISFEQADEFIAKNAFDDYTEIAVQNLCHRCTKSKVSTRKRIARELLNSVNGHLVVLPLCYVDDDDEEGEEKVEKEEKEEKEEDYDEKESFEY